MVVNCGSSHEFKMESYNLCSPWIIMFEENFQIKIAISKMDAKHISIIKLLAVGAFFVFFATRFTTTCFLRRTILLDAFTFGDFWAPWGSLVTQGGLHWKYPVASLQALPIGRLRCIKNQPAYLIYCITMHWLPCILSMCVCVWGNEVFLSVESSVMRSDFQHWDKE